MPPVRTVRLQRRSLPRPHLHLLNRAGIVIKRDKRGVAATLQLLLLPGGLLIQLGLLLRRLLLRLGLPPLLARRAGELAVGAAEDPARVHGVEKEDG